MLPYARTMGLISKLFPRRQAAKAAQQGLSRYFSSFTEYAPTFSTWRGGVYEQALTRSAVERFALSCSKLKPEVVGSAKPKVHRFIEGQPNSYMTWPKFLARCATILDTDTTCAVVPSFDKGMDVVGLWPLKFESAEIVELSDGEPWVRFIVASGDTLAIELANVCFLTRFQYESDFFGGGNDALMPTMQLMDMQQQAQKSAMKNGAAIRFIGRINGLMDDEKMKRKRDKFSEDNLSAQNTSSLLVYDNAFADMQQIDPKHYTIDSDEMQAIQQSVYSYFGINESILQNDFNEDQWGAYYESKVEPFAVQLGEGLTQMLFTPVEQAHGNRIMFSANRLEYASNASKRNMARDMTDRGIISINEAREMLQLPPVDGGDVRVIRGEYTNADTLGGAIVAVDGTIPISKDDDVDFDLGGDDDIYNDTDAGGTKEVDD